jgi:hypothetical protein
LGRSEMPGRLVFNRTWCQLAVLLTHTKWQLSEFGKVGGKNAQRDSEKNYKFQAKSQRDSARLCTSRPDLKLPSPKPQAPTSLLLSLQYISSSWFVIIYFYHPNA